MILGVLLATTLPGIFSDNMVLQRDLPVPVWGEAKPGQGVTVSIAGRSQRTITGADGRWQVVFKPLPVGGPHEMIVHGDRTITLRNVLIGEVWLGSGQSNMNWTLSASKDGGAAVLAADDSELRLSTAASSSWLVSSPRSAGHFPAEAYFFARELRRELGVPVGIIVRAVGTTSSVEWYPRRVAARQPWRGREAQDRAAGGMFASQIEPLVPFALRGVIWDQGESGSGRRTFSLDKMFAALVSAWRDVWGREFAFIFVQFPKGGGLRTGDYVAVLPRVPEPRGGGVHAREHWAETLALPQTEIAQSFDLEGGGHPLDKRSYGQRLALAALARVYGHDTAFSGPRFKKILREGGRLRLIFDHTGSTLTVGGGIALQGFALLGSDRTWRWAVARVEGREVVINEAGDATAVRYCWENNGNFCNLRGENWFAAWPFQSFDLNARR